MGPEPKLPHLQPVTLTSITLQPVPLFTKLRSVAGGAVSATPGCRRVLLLLVLVVAMLRYRAVLLLKILVVECS